MQKERFDPEGMSVGTLTSYILHRYYDSQNLETLDQLLDEQITWIGVSEQEQTVGREEIKALFRRHARRMPRCRMGQERYCPTPISEKTILCSGQFWVTTEEGEASRLKVCHWVTAVFLREEGRLSCRYVHLSSPCVDVAAEEEGLPLKIPVDVYRYFQRKIEEQKESLTAQNLILEQISYQDTMTGLYNRNKFIQVIENWPEMPPAPLGIACFDLNGLKWVNDQQGHIAGDQLLCRAAECLQQVFGDRIYRTGGDEFVALDGQSSRQEFEAAVQAARGALAMEEISCAVGMVWSPACTNAQRQYDQADRKMYLDKRAFYSRRQNDRRQRRSE